MLDSEVHPSIASVGGPESVAGRATNSNELWDAIQSRNLAWDGHHMIPQWVSPESVDLDRFFTRQEVAQNCWDSLQNYLKRDYADVDSYTFLEPSAGDGAFFDLLPEQSRIGIDIVPGNPEYLATDFLSWTPSSPKERIITVGNPPFGYRAWLALAFMNHAATFSDYIGLILPMAFQSDGKGSPKHRVIGAELVEMEFLPPDSFQTACGRAANVNAIWQIWRRGVNNRKPEKTCDDWIDLFTVDMREERLCGQERLLDADWFLQRTFFSESPRIVRDFSEVRYVCGYGIVIKKSRKKITDCLQNTDWRKYSNLAAHNCRHISMYHIRRALTDMGFTDD